MEVLKFKEGSKLLLAVSGGADSMVMLHVLRAEAVIRRYRIDVVTISHGIREESSSDARFVADVCGGYGIRCEIREIDVPAYASVKKLSIETAARILRRRIFNEYAEKYDYICLAHHMSDQAETVLMHLIRGSGISGACGMKEVEGKIARPLFNCSKEEILEYAERNKVRYVQDVTNFSDKYRRNFVRLNLMPLVRELNGGAERTICCFARDAREHEEFAEAASERIPVMSDGKNAYIPAEALKKEVRLLRAYAFRRALRLIGGLIDVTRVNLTALESLLNAQSGRKILLQNGYVAVREFDLLHFYRESGENEGEGGYLHGEKAFHADETIPFSFGGHAFLNGVIYVSEEDGGKGAKRFNASALPEGCVIRTRREGDMFYRFGGGNKKLKEFFTEKRIPVTERDKIPLLAKGKEVYAVIGFEISEKLRVGPEDKALYIWFEEEKEGTGSVSKKEKQKKSKEKEV